MDMQQLIINTVTPTIALKEILGDRNAEHTKDHKSNDSSVPADGSIMLLSC